MTCKRCAHNSPNIATNKIIFFEQKKNRYIFRNRKAFTGFSICIALIMCQQHQQKDVNRSSSSKQFIRGESELNTCFSIITLVRSHFSHIDHIKIAGIMSLSSCTRSNTFIGLEPAKHNSCSVFGYILLRAYSY